MKPAPTLIDTLYRASFRPEPIPGWRSNTDMRHALESARRFVVDERMAMFMAELANESFLKVGMKNQLSLRIADSLRVSARLPHESIWIEYPLRPYQHRAHELRGSAPPVDSELPAREGWLIQQHPKIETACIMHLFTRGDEVTASSPTADGFDVWTFPFAFGWCSDDSPLPWRTTLRDVPWDAGRPLFFKSPSSLLAGLSQYDRDNVNCVRSPLIADPSKDIGTAYYNYLINEWLGVIRRVWSLLATLDHLPLTVGNVRQSKGFLARGRIRKYLNHHTITLHVPAKKDTRVIARTAIADVHRRRHDVRAHWRNDWRNPPSKRCNPHLWEPVDDSADLIRCELCHGRQIFIHKHERGTAARGLVIADYLIKHEDAS